MKLIIDIPEEDYEQLDKWGVYYFREVISKGIPLSEELEKIKNELLSKVNGSNIFGSAYVDVKDINKLFDSRIEELKGEQKC